MAAKTVNPGKIYGDKIPYMMVPMGDMELYFYQHKTEEGQEQILVANSAMLSKRGAKILSIHNIPECTCIDASIELLAGWIGFAFNTGEPKVIGKPVNT